MTQHIARPRTRTLLALMFVVSLLSVAFLVTAPPAAAATSVSQCNSEHNIAGQAIECSYVVTNNLNGTATSSTVEFTHCHGAANDPPTMVCSSNTTTSTDLVTSISQCNYAGDGGGGTMACSIEVTNNITGTVAPTAATVNQCNGSADGSGVASCSPYPASTSGATVTQCNDSGNGGGSTVTCTVDSSSTTTSVLAVSVNQCNNSENGGGSTVTCQAGLKDNITPPAPTPTPTPTATAPVDGGDDDKPDTDSPDEDTSGGDSTTGTPDDDEPKDDTAGENTTTGTPDEGSGRGTPSVGTPTVGTPTSGLTTTQVTRVPSGGLSTGGGSTSGIENMWMLALGILFMVAAVPALLIGRRVSVRS